LKRPNIQISRELCKSQTDAERKLWSLLRNRQLNSVKFRRQFSIDKYVLYFYAPEYKIAIETDGGQHDANDGTSKDNARTKALAIQGIRMLRFSDRDILMNIDGICEVILRTTGNHEKPPHLNPLPLGRGGKSSC
jgi:very-short-patch-repair endonuclease